MIINGAQSLVILIFAIPNIRRIAKEVETPLVLGDNGSSDLSTKSHSDQRQLTSMIKQMKDFAWLNILCEAVAIAMHVAGHILDEPG